MAENLIRMERIDKFYGRVQALDGVNLNVSRQEIVGLLGDNGAGKSTLIKVLSGAVRADGGEIFVRGKRADIRSTTDAIALGIETIYVSKVVGSDLAMAGAVGLAAAAVGIIVMRGVGISEPLLATLRIKPFLRPALGGLLVGLMALVTPHVLGSGHGAIHIAAMVDQPVRAVAIMFLLKCAASIVSLGSGFRGGLFFTSLLIGALGGRLFANLVTLAWPALPLDPHIYAIIGMGALSASVIGAPLTMTFIAL